MKDFFAIYEALHWQCSYYSRHLGHLRGIIHNDDWTRVVDGSLSGRVLLLGNSEITNALILFNTRMFDCGRDTITLQSLASKIPSDEEIVQHHSDRMALIGIEYDVERHLCAKKEFIAANRQLNKNSTKSNLKSLRDYTLAHNIKPEIEPDRATLNDLLDLTEAVNEVVDLAGYMVGGSRGVYREFSSRAEKETKMMYAALPELAKVERE